MWRINDASALFRFYRNKLENISNEKLMIASAIAMTMTAGSAMADVKAGSQGEVQFVGTIAAKPVTLLFPAMAL